MASIATLSASTSFPFASVALSRAVIYSLLFFSSCEVTSVFIASSFSSYVLTLSVVFFLVSASFSAISFL